MIRFGPMFLNIAAYQFAHLSNLALMKTELLACAQANKLKGTILLAPEGVNLFVAGAESGVQDLLNLIRSYPGLSELNLKESYADTQPFTRMLVRIKKETISFGVEHASPLHTQAARISPKELKTW